MASAGAQLLHVASGGQAGWQSPQSAASAQVSFTQP